MDKLKEILCSNNFRMSIVSIFSMFLTANGLENANPENLNEMFGQNGGTLYISVGTLLLNVVFKLLPKFIDKTIDFTFLKSTNFITAIVSVITLFITSYFGMLDIGLVSTIALNVINVLYHMAMPSKKEIVK